MFLLALKDFGELGKKKALQGEEARRENIHFAGSNLVWICKPGEPIFLPLPHKKNQLSSAKNWILNFFPLPRSVKF